MMTGFTRFYRVFPGYIGFYRFLPSFTESNRVCERFLQDFT